MIKAWISPEGLFTELDASPAHAEWIYRAIERGILDPSIFLPINPEYISKEDLEAMGVTEDMDLQRLVQEAPVIQYIMSRMLESGWIRVDIRRDINLQGTMDALRKNEDVIERLVWTYKPEKIYVDIGIPEPWFPLSKTAVLEYDDVSEGFIKALNRKLRPLILPRRSTKIGTRRDMDMATRPVRVRLYLRRR